MNVIKRKAWVLYFPQFDKYYPYVARSTNSFTYDLVGIEKAHIFTNEAAMNRVRRLYDNGCYNSTRLFVEDVGTDDISRRDIPCVKNCVAQFEQQMKTTISHIPDYKRNWWMYDSTKSVVPDPYNTPVEVRLVEFEIDVPIQ